jgi:CRP/FNR family transcriptional regulator, cyclic AMP receptor protein
MSYDGGIALDFFKAAGRPAKVAREAVIFSEKETGRPKIYFLLDGEVALVSGGKPLGAVRKGEIFGEMAAIMHAPRSATAVAKTDCLLIALDDQELEKGLAQKPAFALMLMSLLIGRLRETIARLVKAGALAKDDQWEEAVAFGRKELANLVESLGDAPLYYQQGRQVVSEGQNAHLMYVVVKGRVAVSIGGRVVERLGPGGAFGEAALVDPSPRLASATAEEDAELLPITRKAFLELVQTSPQFTHSMLAALAARLRFLTERFR